MESSPYFTAGNGHGDGTTTYGATAPGSTNDDDRSGGDDASKTMMMQGAPSQLSTEEMMMMRQQQLLQEQQQQQNHPTQLPMASSGLPYQPYMAQTQTMNSAAQLLAAARMSGERMGKEDPSSSMLRYQSSRPDLSPMRNLPSPKHGHGDPSMSSVQQNMLASATMPSNQPPSFIFDGYAGWVCRHCSHLDHYYRGPNYVWMGGQQAPPNHFVEAHLRVCPAINQPWQFGAGAATASNTNRASAPLQFHNMMQQSGGSQHISAQQHATHQETSPTDASIQHGQDQEQTRKRKHEASDPPSGGSGELSLQSGSLMNMNAGDNMSQQAGMMWRQQSQQQNFPQMFNQWQGNMNMMGMSGMGGMNPGMGSAGSGGAPMYPPPPDPTGRSPMGSHTMMPGSMSGAMHSQQPGVVHTGSYYAQHGEGMQHFSPTRKRNQKKVKSNASPKGIHSSDEDYANAVSFLRKRADEMTPLPTAPADVSLIEEGDSNLLTDYFHFIILQLAVCRLTEKDRKTRGGKRQDVAVGYGGLQCIHCATAPSARKFFWSNVDRLANSFAGIPDHVLTCKMCPEDVTEALLVLKGRHNAQMSLLPRGSQKQFFRRMWQRLHAGDGEGAATTSEASSPSKRSSAADVSLPPTLASDSAAEKLKAAGSESPRENLERVTLAVAQDKDWLSGLDCFIREQVEVFCANSNDVSNAAASVSVTPGQVGLRCIHCAKVAGGAQGAAVKYPHSVSGIYESVQELHQQHLQDCPNLPVEMKSEMSKMTESASSSTILRRYYVQAAGALGLFDSDEGGVRAGGRVIPMVGK